MYSCYYAVTIVSYIGYISIVMYDAHAVESISVILEFHRVYGGVLSHADDDVTALDGQTS